MVEPNEAIERADDDFERIKEDAEERAERTAEVENDLDDQDSAGDDGPSGT